MGHGDHAETRGDCRRSRRRGAGCDEQCLARPERGAAGAAPRRRPAAAERARTRPDGRRARSRLAAAREPERGRRPLRLLHEHGSGGAPATLDGGGAEERAGQEHVPRLPARPRGRRPGLPLRHALPVPGSRGRHERLLHARQPRRRREASRHVPRRRRQRLRRRLDVEPVRPPAALHRREPAPEGGVWQATPGDPSTIVKLTTLGYARLRGRPEGRATATSGSSRTSAARGAPSRATRKQPNSFVYRFGRSDRERPDHAAEAAGAAGDRPRRPARSSSTTARPTRTSCRQAMLDLHTLRHDVRDALGHGPRHARSTAARSSTRTRRRRPRTRRRSSAPRTASSGRARGFREFVLHRDGRHRRAHRGRLVARRLRRRLHAQRSRTPSSSHGTLRIVYRGDSRTPASTTSPSGSPTTSSSSRTPATRSTTQRNALDSGYAAST